MLNKIGISKCTKNKLKYFKAYSLFQKITLASNFKPVDNIISFMISHKVLDTDITESILTSKNNIDSNSNTSFISIYLELTYKIIYSSKESKNLHIIDHKCYHIIKIKMPYFIDGLTINQLMNLKRLKTEIYIEDVTISIENSKSLLLSPYILAEAIILPDYVLALNIEMFNSENNLFVSFSEGSRLLQKTFGKNIVYKNLAWCPYNSEIAYLCNETGFFQLYTLNINNRNSLKVKMDFHLGEIHSFCYISNDNIVFSSFTNNVYELFIVNTKTMNIEKITNSIDGSSCVLPKFNKNINKIFFINKQPDGDYLATVNKNGLELNLICKNTNIIDYNLHKSGSSVVILVKEDTDTLTKALIVSYDGLRKKEIICFKENHTVKKAIFSPSKDFLALCINYKEKDDIYFYDLKNNHVRSITSNDKGIYISDFSFSYSGDTLYYSCSKRGNYDVYSINLETFEVKSIINCFSKYISLVYKGN